MLSANAGSCFEEAPTEVAVCTKQQPRERLHPNLLGSFALIDLFLKRRWAAIEFFPVDAITNFLSY